MDDPLPTNLTQEWTRFLADDASRPNGLDSYDDLFNHPLLFPLQRRAELEAMVRVARSIEPESALIVGGDKGGDAYSFLKGIPSIRSLITIEIRGTPYVDEMSKAFPDVNIIGIGQSSYDPCVVEYVKSILENTSKAFDFVFLDGDKGAFLKDFDAYFPMIREGGLCFVHDINPCTPNDPTVAAWKAIKKRGFKTREIIDFSDVQPELDLEAMGKRPATSHAGWLRTWHRTSCGVGVVMK